MDQQFPNMGVGIITGSVSDLSVIDIDPRNGGDITKFNSLNSIRSKTGGGGLHVYCKYNKFAKLLDNILMVLILSLMVVMLLLLPLFIHLV